MWAVNLLETRYCFIICLWFSKFHVFEVLGLSVITSLLTLDSSTQMIVIVQFRKKIGCSLSYVFISQFWFVCLLPTPWQLLIYSFVHKFVLPTRDLLSTQVYAAVCAPQFTVVIISWLPLFVHLFWSSALQGFLLALLQIRHSLPAPSMPVFGDLT